MSDGRKASFVEIAKRLPRIAGKIGGDLLSDPVSLLHGHGSNTWQLHAFSLLHRRQVTDYEDFAVTRQAEVRLNQHTPGAIHGTAQGAAKRGGRDSGCPQDNRSLQSFIAYLDLSQPHPADHGVQADVD